MDSRPHFHENKLRGNYDTQPVAEIYVVIRMKWYKLATEQVQEPIFVELERSPAV